MTEAEALHRTGLALYRDGLLDLAQSTLRAAVAAEPDNPTFRWALAFALLAAGQYAEGWPLLRARMQVTPPIATSVTDAFPEWRGEPLAGRSLLVMREQGFGDQIMMARFAPLLRAQGARVTLAAHPWLTRLFEPLADAVVATSPEAPARVARHDYWTHFFSLPELLGVTTDNLPAAPYLSAPAEPSPTASPAGRVGLVWRTQDPNRSLPAPLAAQLLGRGMVSLQPEDTGAADFAQTAAIIDRLDLVVSIDTAVVHLAGAMGKPVWVMLPHRGLDWRWMRGRGDSPWYPTARLFRQRTGGDWDLVVSEVEGALAAGGWALLA